MENRLAGLDRRSLEVHRNSNLEEKKEKVSEANRFGVTSGGQGGWGGEGQGQAGRGELHDVHDAHREGA